MISAASRRVDQTRSAARALAFGFVGGLLLGVFARAWMRLIATQPEFTWSGSIGVVIGFAIFGLTQSVTRVTRQRSSRRIILALVRVVGVLGMLPLFVAAGAPTMPTVVVGGLALARSDWRRSVRLVLAAIAAGPIVFVTRNLIHDFGLSTQTIGGIVGLLTIYVAIVFTTRSTFAPLQHTFIPSN
jgi:hypothetical protein